MEPVVSKMLVTTEDGRKLCVETGGAADGVAVLVHGGSPNSRHLYGPWLIDAGERGARLISYDRPGYGESTPFPGHTVADGAGDVRCIADALGIDRMAVWGVSGGGPYALATAALLPERVMAVATVGSVAPYGAEGLDYFDGMGESNRDDIMLYFSDRTAARKKSLEDYEFFSAASPEQLALGMKTLLAPVDAAVLTGEVSNWMAECIRDGLAQGDQGWWDDSVSHVEPWGFELGAIRCPVKVFHGRHDRFVPVAHGEWLANHVPGAAAEISEEDGHITMITRITDVHEWLLSHG